MCTVSWLSYEDGYHVFFNRDEQKTRAQAKSPDVFNLSGTKAIMPIDPQGEGTWLAVNEAGVCYALLNYYQGRFPKGKLKSRGRLIKSLAQFTHLNTVKSYLEQQDLNKYPPFSLLCFFPSNAQSLHLESNKNKVEDDYQAVSKNEPVLMIRWNGKTLEFNEQKSPLISSSVKFDDVLSTRLNHFDDLANSSMSCQLEKSAVSNMIDLHASHKPTVSEFSICMHREDAQTVSFSHIYVPVSLRDLPLKNMKNVDSNTSHNAFLKSVQEKTFSRRMIGFSYYDGSPCQNINPKFTELELFL